MTAGQLLALALPARFAAVYAVCFVLSILYSVPPFRLKAVAGADWLINMWGFGTLTPYAGWATTGLPLDADSRLWSCSAFCPLFAALYPLTQLYQLEEDSRRGDRTFALVLGPRRSLDVAIAAVLLAFTLFLRGGIRAAMGPGPAGGSAAHLARGADPVAAFLEGDDVSATISVACIWHSPPGP